LRYFRAGEKTAGKALEAFMRIHYLFSIAAVNLSLVILLTFPLTDKVPAYWIPFTALFYFVNYARDLKMIGYRTSDIFRVYALNILLIPVNLDGVFRSLQQAWNKKKIPFGRTPKVGGRISTPPMYIVAVYFLTGHWLIMSGYDIYRGHNLHALFAGINGSFMLYAIVRFIGVQNTMIDLRNHLRSSEIITAVLSRKVPALSFRWSLLAFSAIAIPPVTFVWWALEKIT